MQSSAGLLVDAGEPTTVRRKSVGLISGRAFTNWVRQDEPELRPISIVDAVASGEEKK